MANDETKLVRKAQSLLVDYRKASGSPENPSFPATWQPLWGAKVERIEINHGATPSVATVWFPAERWNAFLDCSAGDNIRIRTEFNTVLFMGFITALLPSYSGGESSGPGGRPPAAFERAAFVASSYRWLLGTTCPVYGQLARGVDDYDEDGSPKLDNATWLSGQRTVFNPKGRPNMDATSLASYVDIECEVPLFADIENAETDSVKFWTIIKMLKLLFSPALNRMHKIWPLSEDFADGRAMADSLDHDDWLRVLSNITVEGINVMEAAELICRHLGWSFREDYVFGQNPFLIFYKIGDHAKGWTEAHELYAPPPGEAVSESVAEGRKLLWTAELAKDISSIINNPIGLGAPDRFEFTAELVPGWLDSDLVPDDSDGYANLYFTEAQLQAFTDKNSKDYFKYYHSRGREFSRDVGRRWVLNESGRYSNSDTYNRGPAFDLSKVVPEVNIKSPSGKRLFALFKRQLLPCLTVEKDSLNSVGIVVEFCFNYDGPSKDPPEDRIWQSINCSCVSLSDECGFYIADANLAEIVDIAEGTIAEGALTDIPLNLFTSLCDDKVNGRKFYDNEAPENESPYKWRTRIRVTASIQLDQRMLATSVPSSASGSPFLHSQIYDFSEKYGLLKRTTASKFSEASPAMSAFELDSTDYFGRHLDAIRRANEDKSISGAFTLERLWLGNADDPQPVFALGDSIKSIAGREYDLGANLGGSEMKVYPEIIQIIYSYEQQKQKLITRDLRYAEVLL